MSFHGSVLACALALIVCLIAVPAAHAGDWTGYMNVFDNSSGSQGGYLFGSNWGVDALKTTVNTSNPGTIIGDNLTLEPNYNTYTDALAGNDADRAYWTNSSDGGVTAGPLGNKWMEANTIFAVPSISELTYSLTGTVDANTLDSGYTAEAFVKVLDSGSFVTLLNDRVTLPTSGDFAITSDLTFYQGQILQTGFSVSGLNANPATPQPSAVSRSRSRSRCQSRARSAWPRSASSAASATPPSVAVARLAQSTRPWRPKRPRASAL